MLRELIGFLLLVSKKVLRCQDVSYVYLSKFFHVLKDFYARVTSSSMERGEDRAEGVF